METGRPIFQHATELYLVSRSHAYYWLAAWTTRWLSNSISFHNSAGSLLIYYIAFPYSLYFFFISGRNQPVLSIVWFQRGQWLHVNQRGRIMLVPLQKPLMHWQVFFGDISGMFIKY